MFSYLQSIFYLLKIQRTRDRGIEEITPLGVFVLLTCRAAAEQPHGPRGKQRFVLRYKLLCFLHPVTCVQGAPYHEGIKGGEISYLLDFKDRNLQPAQTKLFSHEIRNAFRGPMFACVSYENLQFFSLSNLQLSFFSPMHLAELQRVPRSVAVVAPLEWRRMRPM